MDSGCEVDAPMAPHGVAAPPTPPPPQPPVALPPLPTLVKQDARLGAPDNQEVFLVFDGEHPDVRLGRVSHMKIGLPGECFSLYCTRHQCAIMRRTRAAPTTEEIRQWYHIGKLIPPGKKHAHLHRSRLL